MRVLFFAGLLGELLSADGPASVQVTLPQALEPSRLVQEAEASRVGAAVPFPSNPRLFADYRPLVIEQAGVSNDPRHGYTLGVDGTFEVSGAGGLRLSEADRRVDLARAELVAEQTHAAAKTWFAYVEALLAEQRVERLQASLRLHERLQAAAKERVALGSAGEPEVTTVAVELASVRTQLEEANRLVAVARVRLAQLLDWPTDAPLRLAAIGVETPPAAQPEPELVTGALERRPELRALKARLALLEATNVRLGREALPKLGYNVGLDAAPASPAFAFVGLAIEIPVAQRNQGARAVAVAQRNTEQARLEAELRRVQREVALARESYESRRRQVELLTGEALPNAQRTNALIEEGWRAGRFDVFRLTTVTRELQRVERERLETLLAAWADYVELQRVSGELAP